MLKHEEIQWTRNTDNHNNEAFCSWLHEITPVSQFLQDELDQIPKYKLINSGFLENQDSFIREAIIYDGSTPLIYAQTLFPQGLVDEIPKLTQLGDSSLGFFLLEHGQFQKNKMEFGHLKSVEQLPYEVKFALSNKTPEQLLCRSSILAIKEYEAELLEVFLPGFENLF